MNAVLAQAMKLAKQQIALYGEPIVWKIAGAPVVADATKPWITTQSQPTQRSTFILFTSAKESAFLKLMAGTQIEAGKMQGLMPAVDFIPTDADTVVRKDGSRLSIESISPLQPSGEPLLYYVVFKK